MIRGFDYKLGLGDIMDSCLSTHKLGQVGYKVFKTLVKTNSMHILLLI